MRTRKWTAVMAVLAVLIGGVLYHSARSQTRRLQATKRIDAAAEQHGEMSKVTMAVAVVYGLGENENKVKGKVTFTQKEDGVEVVAELTGLSPGEHGFHVHEFGDCSMADGKCAGGHFNPTKQPHAGPDDAKRHVGDLGNIKANEDGKATYKRVDKMIALNGANSVIGRSVIVHAKPDDFKTQDPPGNAGARIGCGTIGIADPKMQTAH
jgi:superoxide dismutase, Cu-Zn family